MPEVAQPGRIPPVQLKNKIPGSSDPKGAAVDKLTGGVAGQSAAKDSQKRFGRALASAHTNGSVPSQPKYRISLLEGSILAGFAFVVDIIDMILGAFLVTEPFIFIADSIMGIFMVGYLYIRLRLPFAAHWQRYASLLAAFIGEAIPYVDFASFWLLDAIYIVHSVRAEDRATHQQLLATLEEERLERERQEQMEQYQAAQAQQSEEEVEQQEAAQAATTGNPDQVGRIKPKKPNFQQNAPQKQWRTGGETPGRFIPSNGIIK